MLPLRHPWNKNRLSMSSEEQEAAIFDHHCHHSSPPSPRTLNTSNSTPVSVYYSACDLQQQEEEREEERRIRRGRRETKEEKYTKMELLEDEMKDLNGKNMEENKAPNYTTSGIYFQDNERTIDFVLVSKEESSEESSEEHPAWRKEFEANLVREGLEVEEDYLQELSLRFLKVHAPFEVCTRYAEILKLRMPMKEKMDAGLTTQRILLHFPGLPPLEFTPPAVFQEMTDCVSQLFNFVRLDREIFPPKNRHFTAVYSRDKDYLFDVTPKFFTPAIRARIVDFILRRKKFKSQQEDEFSFGIEKLMSEGAYVAAYPLHDGDLSHKKPQSSQTKNQRAILYEHWASLQNFYRYQPVDYIKEYFGVKIGLYFAWLGFYTYMLIPASIVGLLCFLYAVSTINQHAPSNDICNAGLNITMCPLCDTFCKYWDLQETCFHAKFTYLVDNPATIFFTAFMSLWAALFLEMWKRYSAEITHRWDLTGFDIQEEHPRPQYLARLAHIKKRTVNIVTKTLEPRPPFWKMRVPGVMISLSSVVLLVTMALVAVMGVILYRMSVLAALRIHGDSLITSHAILFTSTTAAFINLICIMIFNQVYVRVAERLTELELQRTQTEFDDSLTLKIYLLQFVNYYSSIFYIAFFKGKLVGYPGDYNRVLGSRQEECSPGGCLLELSVQLCIIMVGKQAMNTVLEMILPQLYKWFTMITAGEGAREALSVSPRWAKDYKLVNFDPRGLFPEYLEMVLQYGFVTIFVSSFPLAPFFAFLNNIFEMRLDARKLLTHFRRPISQRVKDIGVWFRILDSIGKFAVISNAFIIAFTSNFIPELVYRHVVSKNDTLGGFLEHSLSTFRVEDYPSEYMPEVQNPPEVCRYPDYRNPPGHPQEYDYAPIFWHVLAARLAFVVVFENVVCVIIMFIKWLIPDIPFKLKEQVRREAYVTNELIIRQELKRARGGAEGEGPLVEGNTGLSSHSTLHRQSSAPPASSSSSPQEV